MCAKHSDPKKNVQLATGGCMISVTSHRCDTTHNMNYSLRFLNNEHESDDLEHLCFNVIMMQGLEVQDLARQMQCEVI